MVLLVIFPFSFHEYVLFLDIDFNFIPFHLNSFLIFSDFFKKKLVKLVKNDSAYNFSPFFFFKEYVTFM